MLPETALSLFGFTDFESRLYAELVRQSPLTGYKLAQLTGKASANTYQSLKTLVQKGAIIAKESEGESVNYVPVPPKELMANLSQVFEARRIEAEKVLDQVHAPPEGELMHQFQTVLQVFERARSMFDTAQEIVLFDFFPGIYEVLEDNILAARARGVIVAGIVYDARHATAYTPYNNEVASDLAELWPGLGMVIVADGVQQLIAQLSTDMTCLLNGVWSDSVFLSCTYHSALASEIRLTAMRLDPSDPLKTISLMRSRPPGLRTIFSRKTHEVLQVSVRP